MSVRFDNSYIDRLFAEEDLARLYHLLGVMGYERMLPEQLWLFCRLREWAGSTRSGVWQYYDGLPEEKFERMFLALTQFGQTEIAEKYRLGRAAWNGPDKASGLDEWIDANEQQINRACFDLALSQKDWLYPA